MGGSDGRRHLVWTAAVLLLLVTFGGPAEGRKRKGKAAKGSFDDLTTRANDAHEAARGQSADASEEAPVDEVDDQSAQWTSCNVTGPCVTCSEEDLIKDAASCKETGHRVEVTCYGGDRDEDRLITYRECGERLRSRALGLGYFEGIMLLVLTVSAPVVLIRRRRLRLL